MKSQKHFTGYAHATPFPLNELPEGTSLCCNGTENVKKMNKKNNCDSGGKKKEDSRLLCVRPRGVPD